MSRPEAGLGIPRFVRNNDLAHRIYIEGGSRDRRPPAKDGPNKYNQGWPGHPLGFAVAVRARHLQLRVLAS
jgi:hypothetical protein